MTLNDLIRDLTIIRDTYGGKIPVHRWNHDVSYGSDHDDPVGGVELVFGPKPMLVVIS